MKYFAELNSENLVINVVVAENIDDCKLSINGTRFIQTYEDGTNGVRAGIGGTWNEEHQIFCTPQMYPSWILNTSTGRYEAPVASPSNIPENSNVTWDEDNQRWQSIKTIADDGSLLDPAEIQNWNPSTFAWE